MACVAGALTAWIGLRVAAVPVAVDGGGGTVPMWRVLTMGVGILPALSLHSSLADLETMGTPAHRSTERRYLLCMFLACAGIYAAIAALTLELSSLAVIARSLAGWLGLALVSGRLLGWRLAWVLPVATLCVLLYWGGGVTTHAWWEFSARPHDDVPSLLLSACLLGGGALAFWATPWRRRRLTSWRTVRSG
jgi:hypothetical protein